MSELHEGIFEDFKEDSDAFAVAVRDSIVASLHRKLPFLYAEISNWRVLHAYEAWCHDINAMHTNSMSSISSEPDHFKHAGIMAYWLRRFSPIIEIHYNRTLEDRNLTDEEQRDRDFLLPYANEYFAFDFGLKLCDYFQTTRKKGATQLKQITREYLQAVLYHLKYKNVSPHSLILIYHSFYLDATERAIVKSSV